MENVKFYGSIIEGKKTIYPAMVNGCTMSIDQVCILPKQSLENAFWQIMTETRLVEIEPTITSV